MFQRLVLCPENLSKNLAENCIWASPLLQAPGRRRIAMEEEESASKKLRIYVGGLGAAMTEDDLRKAFHSVGGVVEAVDFVRTKSRSFAYVDFIPSSQSSVTKLFSTYNGCAWKGGKLRLEKAKEHYLARLTREWEEDAEIMDTDVAADLEVSAPESTEHVAKSEHIQIFFPSLGEVKSLPISGTGTHKYDFPHVEVPSVPVHFCDCEEHNVSAPTGNAKETKTGDLVVENGVVDEEEIKVMNAVMNKLFERKDASRGKCNGTVAVKDKDNSTALNDNQPPEDDKVESEDDDLVLNVMASDYNTKTVPFNSGNKDFKARGNSKGTSRDQKTNNRVQSKKRKSVTSEDFDDSNEYVSNITTATGNANGNTNPAYEPVKLLRPQAPDRAMPIQPSRSQKSSWKTLIRDKSNVSFSISDILPSIPSANEEQAEANDLNLAPSIPSAVMKRKKDKMKSVKPNVSFSISDVLPSVPSVDHEQPEADDLNLAHSSPNRNTDFATDAISESKSDETKSMESFPEAENSIPNVTSNYGRGSSWRLKSSWTQLVTEENTSFSISQILPNSTSEKQVQGDCDAINVNLSARSENDDSKKQESRTIAEDDSAAFVTREDETARNDVEKNEQPAVKENEPSPTQDIERHIMPQQASSFDVKSSETCRFMRNSRSVAEWTRIKAAFSGESKKKKQKQ